jgi:hypothetical protein
MQDITVIQQPSVITAILDCLSRKEPPLWGAISTDLDQQAEVDCGQVLTPAEP